jgi:HSP20 family molecular chaperone IbpA
MRCENCGREIDNTWGICPYCGYFSGELRDSFMNIARMLGGKAVVKQEGDSFIVILEFQGTRRAFRIVPIELEEVSPHLASSLSPDRVSKSEPEELPRTQKERTFDKTEEPKTDVNHSRDSIYIKVNLPGIPEEDIEVDELEDSIEVRGYKGKTRFFKLIPVPKGYLTISTEMLSGEVIITMRKK